jgi:PAS domain S-box-containing protein
MTRESAYLSVLAPIGPIGPIEEDRGPLAGMVSWFPRGITQKASALATLQNRLMARTQFVDRALQSVEDGLLITDLAGRIAFANPRASKIFGVAEGALLGDNLLDRLNEVEYGGDKPLEDRAKRDTLSRLLDDRKAVEREIVIAMPEPRTYTLRMAAVSATPGRDEHDGAPLGVVATLSDITKQRELRQMQNDVMTLVTHEMKTPLTAIRGMSEVLMKFEPDGDKRRRMHATIHEASERLTRMIDDYLDLTRLESGARSPHPAFHHIESLIERTLLLLDPLAATRGMELTRNFAPDLPVFLLDADLLARALTNLVANAIKYSPAGTEVVISAEASGGYALVSVADRGPGIPREYQAHIFEKFFRVPHAENADTPGTGLGLALVREIAELHGGRVTVESETGTGSTFTLRLPLKS